MGLGSRVQLASAATAALSAAFLAAGCGSSDEPAYCSTTSDLQSAIGDVKDDATSGNFSSLQSDLKTVQSDANAVVSEAQQDFASETAAVKSSVSQLSTAVEGLPSSPTAQQLAKLLPEISAVVTAADNLANATKSSCD